MAATVSFANDIMPILYKYQGQMMWRFDMADYDNVKANAEIIYGMITGDPPGMPPPPYPPLGQAFVATFKSWMDQGCPQ